MRIYHYHEQTGAYLGEGTADADPLTRGVWLIPAHATTVAPGRLPAIWNGQAWQPTAQEPTQAPQSHTVTTAPEDTRTPNPPNKTRKRKG